VFYIDVAKVDQDVVHVAMVFSSVSQKFHLFQTYIVSVSSDVAKIYLDVAYTCMLQAYVSSVSGVSYVCCKCFIWMLHKFCKGYKHIFLVFQMYVASVSNVSNLCCKVFHLDVA
jgi:hypothetical protein